MNINELKNIAVEAGVAILNIYNDDDLSRQVEHKDDNSPLTKADKASHEVIIQRLTDLYPEVPIMSEEDMVEVSYEERSKWKRYWCVDPLDGTKEFIKRNGEFTVNIALIEERYPTLGIIHVPVTGITYVGSKITGAMKFEFENDPQKIVVRSKPETLTSVRSRSHASEEEERLYEKYHVNDFISKGSSLKFCMIAEGIADLYYRHNPTMEWDTAAGQAILEAAGGAVFQGNTELDRFIYNKEELRNGSFLCVSHPMKI